MSVNEHVTRFKALFYSCHILPLHLLNPHTPLPSSILFLLLRLLYLEEKREVISFDVTRMH